eukprot:233460_1
MVTPSSSTTIGACIAITASILNAIGFTLQKQGHNKLKQLNKDSPRAKSMFSDKTWRIGFGIFLLGGLANAIALYFAPQSLVLPLSAITLVANTILATQILGEPFEKKSYFGVCLVIIGSTLAVMFGPRTGGEHINITMLKQRWSDLEFLIFFCCLSALTIVDFIGIKYYEKLNRMDVSVQEKEVKHGRTFLLLSYGLMNGYFGSNAFLFLKAFTEFLGASFSSLQDAQAALVSWYSYFILFCVVLSNVLFVMWQQRGLSYFPSVYVIPINQVTLIIMGSVLGGVYFDEFSDFSAMNGALFLFSIVVTSCGVLVLAAGHKMFDDIDVPLKVGGIMESGRVSECGGDQSDFESHSPTTNDYMAVKLSYKVSIASDFTDSFTGAPIQDVVI